MMMETRKVKKIWDLTISKFQSSFNKIRNEKGEVTIDNTETQSIIRE